MRKIKLKGSFLPSLSLNRPVSTLMLLTALLSVGFIAYTRIPAKMMPEGFSFPMLWMWIPYENSSPREVEEQIAKPVEEIISTVRNLKKVESTSSQRGMSMQLEFESGTDMALAYSQVIDRLDRVMPDLPEDADRRFLFRWTPNNEPLIWAGIEITNENIDDPFDLLDRYLIRKLQRVDGIAKVDMYGARRKYIFININNDAVKAHRVNVYQLYRTLRSANFTLSGGYIKEGGRKLYISSVGKFKNLEEIKNLIIKGTTIRVRDIADVKYEFAELTRINRINRNTGIAIAAYPEERSDPIALSKKVKDIFEAEFETNSKLDGFKYYVLFTQGDIMTETLDDFKLTALVGGLFAITILYFFLRRWKMTLIISVALPLSLLTMVVILYFMGWSLNMITMMGLILSVGMVVDNSIVVAENIFRLRLTGKPRKEAALEGASEVSLAITMSTLTTIVVFMPMIFMGDQIWGFIMSRLGTPIILSILASLFIALYFIPLGTAFIPGTHKTSKSFITRLFDAIYKRTVGVVHRLYLRALKFTLRHRFEMLLFFLFLFLTMFIAIPGIPRSGDVEGNINDFRMIINLPENFTLEETDQKINMIETHLYDNKEKYGIKAIYSRFRSTSARVHVFLLEDEAGSPISRILNAIKSIFKKTEEKMIREEVIESIKKHLDENKEKYTGLRIRWSWADAAGSGDTSVNVNLYGRDLEQLEMYANEVKRRLSIVPEILSVETDYEEEGKDEIQLKINRRMAKSLDVDPMTIAGTVAYSLRGNLLTRFQIMDREIDVYLQLRDEDRKTLEQLKNMTVMSNSGRQIPISVLVTPVIQRGPSELKRENRKTMMRVKVTTTEKLSLVTSAIQKQMANINMKRGYTWSFGRRFERMQDSESGLGKVLPVVLTFVFFLMGVLFESFVLPLSVLGSIPFAFWGAIWMLFITGSTMDPMAIIGMTILIGVVVNNAIVLIDFVNRLRQQGYSRTEALIEAGNLRFRPIIMTALTTIFGLLPMTIGSRTAGISYAPLGRAFTGGLLASTISTLFLVPLFYTCFDDLRSRVWDGLLASVFRKKVSSGG